ncbi:MAG: hypothetical protein NDI73_03990 [Desulfuromonadales bacterium]|nr:hypothetical protein [Desulfuromonadales bacterium]
MTPSHFDIAIVGDSLAARMAAALLAKHGKRLLLLSTAMHRDSWVHSSLFTERLLRALGARDAHTSFQPFQVLSSRARVTIHPDFPLTVELLREFGSAASQVEALLDGFERDGTFLEELLWKHGGLPSGGMRETVAWRWLCLRHKLPLAQLTRPLTERLHGFPDAAAEWLCDLFQGLSLQPLATLTVADGAFLWAHACRPGGVAGEELDELLNKRFEQFHGTEIQIDALDKLEHSQKGWIGSLPGGRRFQAGQLVLGELGQPLPGHGPLPSHRALPPAGHFATSKIDGQLSALLERRVIVGGPLPVRMAIVSTSKGLIGEVGSSAVADESGVRRQLEPILPFASYSLDSRMNNQGPLETENRTDRVSLVFNCPLQLGNHLWCADETRLLPQLGSGGAALLAWTLAREIDPTIIPHVG